MARISGVLPMIVSKKIISSGLALTACLAMTVPAHAGQDPFVGQMMVIGANFCPRGYAEANGALIPIAQSTALFSLLGTQFGGNGTTNFALPDMRQRMHVGDGQGPSLSLYDIGQSGGQETKTVLVTELPSHTHSSAGPPQLCVGDNQ
jgi:microcystin-dependent protein